MMLPEPLRGQIREAWKVIDRKVYIELQSPLNGNGGSQDFKSFIQQFVGLSDQVEILENVGDQLRISLWVEDQKASLHFEGIPLGHELTSFVLAPLALTHKSKMPDSTTMKRIEALDGRGEMIRLETYISLSCENCPIVVQALNMMAAIHPNMEHTMIDGSLNPDEMERLGIRSVPTVRVNGANLSTGRQELSGLLEKLEEQFAPEAHSSDQNTRIEADVLVVGGGPAGASAAIYTSRKGLKTVIVAENIGGQVRETKGIENQIGTAYIEGPQLAEQFRNHIDAYDISVYENQRVLNVEDDGSQGYGIQLKGGLYIQAKSIIAATGARWRELNVKGEKEYLGKGVAFCPHCDGPFYKGKEIAVVGGGNSGVEAALDLANICSKVSILEYGPELKADRILLEKVNASENIEVITEAKTLEIVGDGSVATGLKYENMRDGESVTVPLAGVFIQIGLVPNSSWLNGVVDMTDQGEIKIDECNRTSASGIFAAGDVSTVPYKQIVIATGEGAKAGLSTFEYHLKNL